MATTNISHDQDAIQAEVHIAAPPERVFQALTDPRQLMLWWGQRGMYHHTDWKGDVRPGGAWRSEGVSDRDGKPYQVSGEYVEVDPPRVVSYTWVKSWAGPEKTLVRWELEAVDGGTMVRLRHSGFATDPSSLKNHYEGWTVVIGWMQAFVENGDTVDTRPQVAPTPHR
ncbi:MAG: SRPBCC domain-containing protein [Terriglobales bacterium]